MICLCEHICARASICRTHLLIWRNILERFLYYPTAVHLQREIEHTILNVRHQLRFVLVRPVLEKFLYKILYVM
jgi:hypothetical protein